MDCIYFKKQFSRQYLENDEGQAPIVLMAIIPICILVSMFLPRVNLGVALGVGIGIFFFVVAFVKTEIALYILILSMLLSPEIGIGGGEGGQGGMEAKKSIAIRIDDLLLVVMMLSYLGRMAVAKDIGIVGKTPLNKYIGFYLLACVFSTIVGMMMGNVRPVAGFFFVLKYFEYYVVFYAVINYIHKEDQVKSFIKVIMLTCLVVCIVGLAQIPAGGRVTAPFEGEQGEPNTMGGYLLLIMALNGGLYLHLTIPWIRRLLFWNFFIIILPLLATGSRGTWMGVPFVYGMWIIFSKKKATLVVSGLIVALLLPVIVPKNVKDRFMYTFTQKAAKHRKQAKLGAVALDTSTTARLESMKSIIQDWQKRPLQGYGVTGYSFVDAQFFKVLIDTGLIGICTFLILLVKIFQESYRVFQTVESPFHRGIAHGFMAGFVGLCAHALGANTFIIVRVMEPFWFLAGIVLMLPTLEAEEAAALAALREKEAAKILPPVEVFPPPQGMVAPPGFHPGSPTLVRNMDLLR
ncbi:MAG: O-antigen ligase family protein [Nitrospinae bacterium]|nr:O-antigen ligase family protein [Nitrospinota bacterium]